MSELLMVLLVTLTVAPVYRAWIDAGRPTLEEL